MKNIAIISDISSYRVERLINILSKEYNFIVIHSYDEAIDLFEKKYDDISAVIIDNPSEHDYTEKLISYVEKKNTFLFSSPILLLSDQEKMDLDDRYLSDTVVGVLRHTDSERVLSTRIRSAIKFCNSTSFDEFSDLLKELPSLIYLKDKDGRYAFCSQNWHHLNTDESIRGKTDFEVRKDLENAKKARESDLKVIESGKEMTYVIKEEDDEGLDYLKVVKKPIKNKKGEVTGIIAIINNITDEVLLNQELRQKSITDQLTGLYNRVYFEELAKEKETTFETPITFITADCDGLKKINDKFGHAAGDKYICYARNALKDSLPNDSLLFRMGGDEFLAVCPGVDKKNAERIIDQILLNAKKYKNNDFALRLSAGSYTIHKTRTTIESALMLSDKAMYKMKKDKKHR